jgi:hypothetical protein
MASGSSAMLGCEHIVKPHRDYEIYKYGFS